MNDKKTFTGLYFGALPDLKDLVCCLIEEENDEELNTIQPLGCREFVFTEPRVLLSPCLENGKQAFIICKGPVLNCNKFKALMAKLRFKVVRTFSVSNELFQYCLAFTITQKLAPMWNKIGEYFVQGRDFFHCNNKLNAVSFDVNITDRLCIGVKAYNIKLHPAKAAHFCFSSNILQNFLTQRNFTIQQDSIQDDLCFVLPSLKKARVVGISHEMPPEAPFSCYEDLRKHWKLMYGYRLPPDEITFYDVRFFGSKVFTYPASCIHSNYPHISPRCDQQAIFQAFLEDIQSRIPFICEIPLRLTSSALYSTNKLHSAVNNNQSSLTRAVPSQFQHCKPFVFSTMQSTQNSNLSNTTQNQKASSDPRLKQVQNSKQPNHEVIHTHTSTTACEMVPQTQVTRNTASVSCDNANGFPTERSRQNNDFISNVATMQSFQRSAESHIAGAPVSTTSNTGPRIVPTFTKRVPQKPLVQRRSNEVSAPKVCPVFKSKVSSSKTVQNTGAQSKHLQNTTKGDGHQHTGKGYTLLNGTPSQPEVVSPTLTQSMSMTSQPHSQANQEAFSLSQNNVHQNRTSVEINKVVNGVLSHARKLPEVRPGLSLSRGAMSQRTSFPGNITKRPNQDYGFESVSLNTLSKPLSMASSPRSQPTTCTTGTKNSLLAKPLLSNMQGYNTGSSSAVYTNTAPQFRVVGLHNDRTYSQGNVYSRGSNQGTPCKRQMDTSDVDSVSQTKKPRSKPKLQDDIDVRQLALNNQLKKVNTITLIDWLKKHNVPVKQKDKKGELMEKVMNIIKSDVHEA